MAVHTIIEETVCATAAACQIRSPCLYAARSSPESHHSNLYVAGIRLILVSTQTLNKRVHDVFCVIRTVTIGSGRNVVAGHTRRYVVYNQHVNVRCRFNLCVGVSRYGQFKCIRPVTISIRRFGVFGNNRCGIFCSCAGCKQAACQHRDKDQTQHQSSCPFPQILHDDSSHI